MYHLKSCDKGHSNTRDKETEVESHALPLQRRDGISRLVIPCK